MVHRDKVGHVIVGLESKLFNGFDPLLTRHFLRD
jgi:hypothetical protein